MFPRPCSEFPNDNPALYEAVVSLGAEPGPTASDELVENESIVAEPHVEATPTVPEVDESLADEPQDPFVNLVFVLENVAKGAGASDGQAAAVRGLLGLERIALGSLPEAALEALFDGMQLEGTRQTPRRAPAFTQAAVAWRAILRGDGGDFASCGGAMLDEWTADLLARLLGSPALAAQIRRELRRRGVAAFGLVEEAA
jgi:hypothetical protein